MLLSVGSATPVGSVAHFENSTGSCYINPTTTSLSCSSDIRLKTNVNPLASTTLGEILALNPVTYNWTRESATSSPHTGFIAQEVQPILPDLISSGPDGYLTMNYAGLTTYIVKAVQEIAAKLSDLAATVASFADHFTTKELTFTRATGKELCLSDTPDDPSPVCVTKAQLATLLSQSAAAGFANPSPAGTPSNFANPTPTGTEPPTIPPVITIAGANPAHINVGDTYSDLGATAKDTAGHDLGVKTFQNGTLVSDIVLDTSTSTTDTINYVATDQNGLTSTSTRTVIIEAPVPPPNPAAPASSTAATSTTQ
jgi:hypothetical protein